MLIQVLDSLRFVHFIEIFEIFFHRIHLSVEKEVIKNFASEVPVHKYAVQERLYKEFLFFDDIRLRFWKAGTALEKRDLDAWEEFSEESAECLYVFQSAFDFYMKGISSDLE